MAVSPRTFIVGGITSSHLFTGPGSFLEVRKILPLLVDGNYSYPSFHVVALSLPGFGFSQGPSKKNFKRPQYAEVGESLP